MKIISFLFLAALSTTALAQFDANIGIKADQAYQSTSIDAVSLLTGNVTHKIPIASYPQKGNLHPLEFSYTLNSNPYYRQATCDSYSEQCVIYYAMGDNTPPMPSDYVGIPFRDNYNQMTPVAQNFLVYDSGNVCDSPDPELLMECVASFGMHWGGAVMMTYSRKLSFYDETGASHPLFFDATDPTWARASDGSGYAWKQPNNFNAYNNFATPQGTIYDAAGNYADVASAYAWGQTHAIATDVFGNQIKLVQTPIPGTSYSQTLLVDSVGRSFGPQTAGDSSKCPAIGNSSQTLYEAIQWSAPGMNGGSSTYTVCYTVIAMHPGFFLPGTPLGSATSGWHCDDIFYNDWNLNPDSQQFPGNPDAPPFSSIATCDQEFQAIVPQAIVLPNGSYWGFLYDAGSSTPCDNLDNACTTVSYGTVQKVTLPTGASISYQYADIAQDWAHAFFLNYRVLTQRTTTDLQGQNRTEKYQYQNVGFGSSGNPTAIATDPLMNDTVHVFGAIGGDSQATNATDRYTSLSSRQETETRHYQGAYNAASPVLLQKETYSYQGQIGSSITNETVQRQNVTQYEGSTMAGSQVATYPATSAYQYYLCTATTTATCSPQYTYTILRNRPTDTVVWNGDGTAVSETVTSMLDQVNGTYAAENILNKISKSQVLNGGGGLMAETDYGYDGGSSGGTTLPAANTSISQLLIGGSPSVISFTYNSDGTVATITDPNGSVTKINSYQCNGLYPASVTTAYSSSSTVPETTTSTIDCNTGATLSASDANGIVTSFEYSDPLNRPTRVKSAVGTPQEAWIQYSYPTMSEVDMAEDLHTVGDGALATVAISDGIGHVLHVLAPGGVHQDIHYDLDGLVDSQTNPYYSTSDSTYGLTTFVHDGLGRLTKTTHPDGQSEQTCYQGIASTGQTICRANVSSYPSGIWADSSDAAGNSYQRVSDGAGRLVRVVEPGTIETRYNYDALNNLLSVDQIGRPGVVPPGFSSPEVSHSRSFTYDSRSRILTATNPETGTVCYGTWSGGSVGSGTCQGGYDANGNLIHKTNASGVITTYSYDALNRVHFETFSNGGPTWGYGYDGRDENGNMITRLPTANSIGRATHISNEVNAGGEFQYDALGRVIAQNMCLPSDCSLNLMARASYDLAGNMTQLTYPDGRVVSMGWDGAGRLSSVNDITGGGNSPYIGSLQYFASGALQNATLGNGVTESFVLNSRLQPCHMMASSPLLSASPSGGNLLDRQLFYGSTPETNCGNASGNNGNIWSVVEGVNHSTSQSFQYDGLNRLTSAYSANRPSAASYNQIYNYDSFGNMLPVDQLHTPMNYGIDSATNRLTLNGSLTTGDLRYNPDGTLLNSPTGTGGYHTYSWTGDGLLSGIDGASTGHYIYDPQGNRVYAGRNSDSSWNEYVYFNGKMIADLDNHGVWTDHVYANGQKIASAASSETLMVVSGTAPSSGGNWNWYELPTDTSYVVQTGDRLVWRQYGTATARGGMLLLTSTGGNTGWHSYDTNGQLSNSSTTSGQWEWRVLNLDSLAGGAVSVIAVGMDQWTTGAASLAFADIALMHADGTVARLFNGQPVGVISGNGNIPFTNPSLTFVACGPTFPCADSNGRTAATHYYLADQVGTTQTELSQGGWPVWQGWFTPFGQEIINGGEQTVVGPVTADGTSNRFKFTGKERDTESGLDYFGARYYASSMGRFTSPDPSGLAAENPADPQSWNLYAYARNNPLINIDPTGLDCVYYNDAGTGLDDKLGEDGKPHPIDHNSTAADCKDTGGNWEEGTTYAEWQHYDATSDTWTGASTDGANAYFYEGKAAGTKYTTYATQFSRGDTTRCKGNCLGSPSTIPLRSLLPQLRNGGTLSGLLMWAVSQGPEGPGNPKWVGDTQSTWVNGGNWCGSGGAGRPSGVTDWACMVHDYEYNTNDFSVGSNFVSLSSRRNQKLRDINETLCDNVVGLGGFEIKAYFHTIGSASSTECRF